LNLTKAVADNKSKNKSNSWLIEERVGEIEEMLKNLEIEKDQVRRELKNFVDRLIDDEAVHSEDLQYLVGELNKVSGRMSTLIRNKRHSLPVEIVRELSLRRDILNRNIIMLELNIEDKIAGKEGEGKSNSPVIHSRRNFSKSLVIAVGSLLIPKIVLGGDEGGPNKEWRKKRKERRKMNRTFVKTIKRYTRKISTHYLDKEDKPSYLGRVEEDLKEIERLIDKVSPASKGKALVHIAERIRFDNEDSKLKKLFTYLIEKGADINWEHAKHTSLMRVSEQDAQRKDIGGTNETSYVLSHNPGDDQVRRALWHIIWWGSFNTIKRSTKFFSSLRT